MELFNIARENNHPLKSVFVKTYQGLKFNQISVFDQDFEDNESDSDHPAESTRIIKRIKSRVSTRHQNGFRSLQK